MSKHKIVYILLNFIVWIIVLKLIVYIWFIFLEMASKALYESHTVKNQPSIFEVVASDSLVSNLEAAIERCFTYLTSKAPVKLRVLTKYFDEIYLLLSLINHYFCLKQYSASFAEIFYGLKRVSLHTHQKKLARREVLLSVLFLSVWPYLRKRLKKKAVNFQFDEADGIAPRNRLEGVFRKIIIFSNSAINFTYETMLCFHYLAYMSGSSPCHSPLLRLANVMLERTLDEALPETNSQWSMLMKTVSWLFQLLVFSLQFVSVWNSDHYRKKLTSLPIPEAPKPATDPVNFSSICPICKNKRRIDTVLPVSGYVFCFRCIYSYLNEHHCCPVTKYPASTKDLIRLFVPKS